MSKVSVLGSGVVGRATGIGLKAIGHDVTFVDLDEDRLSELREEGHTTQHVDEMSLYGIKAVFVSVPTPAAIDGIDTAYLDLACKTLGRLLQTRHRDDDVPLLVFRSTMPPGTTRQRVIPALESGSGKRAGIDFLVCYNPEYLRAYNAVEDFLQSRLLTIGTAEPADAAAVAMKRIFARFADVTVAELSFEEAEYQKYVHNVFNAMKISFFNEMRSAALSLGLENVDRIFALTARTAEAAWNPSYGTRDRGPFGGACLPKDIAAWTGFARKHGIGSDLADAARAVNIGLGGSVC